MKHIELSYNFVEEDPLTNEKYRSKHSKSFTCIRETYAQKSRSLWMEFNYVDIRGYKDLCIYTDTIPEILMVSLRSVTNKKNTIKFECGYTVEIKMKRNYIKYITIRNNKK